jgi:hypothetical protein
MLNLIPQHEPEARPEAYAEAVSRLATVRHALRLVDGGFAEGPGDDVDDRIAGAWDEAGEAKQRSFERRSARLVGSAAAGIEAMLNQQQQGHEPHRLANEALVAEIRRELRAIAGIILN